MAFKPKNSGNDVQREYKPLPTPDSGSQEARISLIVDLGEQKQEGFIDKETQKYVQPKREYVQELAVFADLVDCIRDYGEPIGEQQYRQLLNGVWDREIKGAKFEWAVPRDKDGNEIPGKPKTFHPRSMLREIAVKTNTMILGYNEAGEIDLENNMDVELLLNKPIMIDIEVTENADKNGKKDKDGNVIVYKNVKIKDFGTVPKKLLAGVAELRNPAMLITFDDVTEEQAKFLRKDIIRKIQTAKNYPGSQMEAVLSKLGHTVDAQKPIETAKEPTPAAAVQEAPKDVPVVSGEASVANAGDDFSSDLPF